MVVLEVGQIDRRTFSGAAAYRVEFVRDWRTAESHWSSGFGGTSFQDRQWFDAWYRAFDKVSPLIAIATDAATHAEVALVPLIHHVQGGIRRVEFADLDL